MKIRTKIGANKFTKYAKRVEDFREYDLFANVIDKISEEIPLALQETIEKTPSALVPGKIGRRAPTSSTADGTMTTSWARSTAMIECGA